ncbi:MAG: energy transducer TonB, partial [Polaromonas sp.]|nr:energy transducer TonB [Polaromonas sp.]
MDQLRSARAGRPVPMPDDVVSLVAPMVEPLVLPMLPLVVPEAPMLLPEPVVAPVLPAPVP